MVQLVFCDEEHLIGSSGGVQSTIEKNRENRVNAKAFCDILIPPSFKHNKGMVGMF